MCGLWVEQTEGVTFRLKVFNDLKTRGDQDILVAVVDGLKRLAEAIHTVYPRTTVQICIVHLIRNRLDYAGWKDRKLLAQALRPVYTVIKPLWLAPRNVLNKSVRRAFDWKSAMSQFANLYGDRFALVKGWSEQWNF